jgi:hypothetical protein
MGIFLASLKVKWRRRTLEPNVSASMSSVPTAYTLPFFTCDQYEDFKNIFCQKIVCPTLLSHSLKPKNAIVNPPPTKN